MRAGAWLILLLVQIVCCGEGLAAADARPNVLLVMTDDQGFGDITSHGNPYIKTPVMDGIAADGARFERFFVSPVCAPTRAGLLTGRYHLRTGTHGVTRGMENMRAEEVTIAEAFRQAGYATGCFGKWHNGRHYPLHPNGQGFDEIVGFCAGHWNNYFDTELEHNGEPLKTDGFITDVLTDHAMDFIDQHRDEPFFCYVPYNAPHSPWQVPDKYWDRYKDHPDLDEEAKCAYAMVESLDDNIGRLLKKLDALSLREKTIVLFLTDNGANSDRYNAGMRGRKGSVHEGGTRVPLFVRWPGVIEPGTVIRPIAKHVDLFPTLVDLCGIEMPETLPQDGMSFAPLLRGEPVAREHWEQRTLFTFRYRGGSPPWVIGAARDMRYRAVYERANTGWELYDMQADPGESKNIAKDEPAVLARLRNAFEQISREIVPNPMHPLPIPVGYPEQPLVELPAHEAFLHPGQGDGINYLGKNGFANDWIDQWTDAMAFPYWTLDVADAGEYQVRLLCSCDEANVGTELQAEVHLLQPGESHATAESSAASKVAGQITTPLTVEVIVSPDRIPRTQAPERVWHPLKLGTLRFPAGPVELRVRATAKPGPGVIDLKAIRLSRLEPASTDNLSRKSQESVHE